jgi:outer membrane protein OmpA-like peptidoglycan-associated protein
VGTCVVTATRKAKGSTPKVSSKPVDIHFDLSLTIEFAVGSGSLSHAAKAAIANFAKSLRRGDVAVSTGYAKGDRALASKRAASVARYLANFVKVHVTMRSITSGVNNRVVVAA